MSKRPLNCLNKKTYRTKFLLGILFLFLVPLKDLLAHAQPSGLPLYYWREPKRPDFVNFGDYLSLVLVERILGQKVKPYSRKPKNNPPYLLAVGSILWAASENSVVWGSGVHAKILEREKYNFKHIDVRAVRGPITRQFIQDVLQIDAPETYGDPALLFPYLFPEFKKKANPSLPYLIIAHYRDSHLFPKSQYTNVVYATEPWDHIVNKILDSRLVISSTLHGIVVAESFKIPARMLRLNELEPLLKFADYYRGTNRANFTYASSVEEAVWLAGEPPAKCDLEKLYNAFPFDYWPNVKKKHIDFTKEPGQ